MRRPPRVLVSNTRRFVGRQCSACLCVGHEPEVRCAAIQQLVRSNEVEHLIRWSPYPARHTLAESVAAWIRDQRGQGTLDYFRDPEHCDRWCSPACVLEQGGGDCDDFALLAVSLLQAGDLDADVMVGRHCTVQKCEGHAWVEGHDERGWFLLEAVHGWLFRTQRPDGYIAQLALRPGWCRAA